LDANVRLGLSASILPSRRDVDRPLADGEESSHFGPRLEQGLKFDLGIKEFLTGQDFPRQLAQFFNQFRGFNRRYGVGFLVMTFDSIG
jgi:hypothetical protein